MWFRLAYSEAVRTLVRPRFWMLVAVNAAFVLVAVVMSRNTVYGGTETTAPIALASSLAVLSLLPITAPFCIGDSLVADRLSGYLVLQTTRGARVPGIVSTRGCAAAATAAIAAVLCAVPAAIAAYALHPASGGDPAAAVSFMPGLLGRAPAAHVLLMSVVYGVAAGAVCCVAIAAGTFVRRPAAAAATSVALLGTGLVIPVQSLNPLERIMFANTFGVSWTQPGPMFAYWAAVATVGIVIAVWRLETAEAAW